MQVFRSVHFRGSAPAPYVYAQALSKPLALVSTILIIGALVDMLQGRDPMPWVWWLAPAVIAIVSAWKAHDLARTPAVLVIDGGRATVLSTLSAARRDPASRMQTIFTPKHTPEGVFVSIGRNVHLIRPEDWPGFDELAAALGAAAEQADALRFQQAAALSGRQN
jgi:hypothetical protein